MELVRNISYSIYVYNYSFVNTGVMHMKEDKLEKKIKRRRRILKFLTFIIFISAIVVFLLKSDYFVVKNVAVKDNKYVQTKEVIVMAEVLNKNIFMLKGSDIKEKLCNNPYIEDIGIRKRLPSTIEISIKEKSIMGLVQIKSGFINVDSNGKMVQVVNQFPGKGLPLIEGVKVEQYIPNDSLIKKDDIRLNALKEALKASRIKELENRIYSINVADAYNIVYKTTEGIEIRVGDSSNLNYKLSYALTILNSAAVKGNKGYIEIQQDGNAIFKKVQQEVKK